LPLNGYLGCNQTEETVYVAYISNLSNHILQLTTRICIFVGESLQLHLKNLMLIQAGDSHRYSVVTISARSWSLLDACWYKRAGLTLPQLLLTQDPGCKIWFLSGCLIQLAIDNFTNVIFKLVCN